MNDKDDINRTAKSRWVIFAFAALTILIVLFGLAFLVSGRQVIERPILVFFLLVAWLGLLSVAALGSSKI